MKQLLWVAMGIVVLVIVLAAIVPNGAQYIANFFNSVLAVMLGVILVAILAITFWRPKG